MLQDIFPHQFYNQYDRRTMPKPEDFAFVLDGGHILMKKGKMFPQIRDLGMEHPYTYLFSVDETHFFLLRELVEYPADWEMVELRSLRGADYVEKHMVFAAMTAKHLADWYRDNQFCGRCGTRMGHSETERAMTCPACRNTVYPRIMPAVIVGVINGNQLLLTRYRTGFRHNALIAGFTEIGETAEETVAREVMEEAGIRVKNIRYYKTQPWGIANDLLLGYYCDVDGDTNIRMDTHELRYAQWVPREEIVLQPDDYSLTNEMMLMFKNGMIHGDHSCCNNGIFGEEVHAILAEDDFPINVFADKRKEAK